MKYRVVTEPQAEADIENAFRWISQNSPKNALRWHYGLEVTIDSLQTLPQRCPLAPENDAFDAEIRQLLYGRRHHRYRILFTIRGKTVQILHVRHGARKHLIPAETETKEGKP